MNQEERDKIYSYVRMALPLMSKYKIPAIPENYTIWYQYVSGTDQALVKDINGKIEKGEQFDPEVNRFLYKEYCIDESGEELNKLKVYLQDLLKTVSDELGQLTGYTEEYQGFISNSITEISQHENVDGLKDILGKVIKKTKGIGEVGKDMHDKLAKNSEQLKNLQKEFLEAKAEAMMDFLTQIPNRKALDQSLDKFVNQVNNNKIDKLCFLFVDIDFFKKFNDNHGHMVGDQVLKYVAGKMKEMIKGRDILARYGGEEFAIILPLTPLEGATTVAEAIRNYFDTTKLALTSTAKELGKITVSIGVGCYRPGESIKEFVKRSDQALYKAKNSGRNKVVTELELKDN